MKTALAALCACLALPAALAAEPALLRDLKARAGAAGTPAAVPAVEGEAVETLLTVQEQPGPAQAREAIAELQRALARDAAGDRAAFKAGLDRAHAALEAREARKSFPAVVRCGRKRAFQSQAGYDDCDISNAKLCYQGRPQDALALIEAALAADYWQWDEISVQAPRLQGTGIVIDVVDGPNDSTRTRAVIPCR